MLLMLNHMRVAHPEMVEIGRGVFDLKVTKHEVIIVPAFNEVICAFVNCAYCVYHWL